MPPTTLPEIRRAVTAVWPMQRWQHYRTVIAVSGGADSCALLHLLWSTWMAQVESCSASRPPPAADRFIVAHVNHGLRGPESDGDQRLVQQFGQSLGLKVVVGHLDQAESNLGLGLEGRLRAARYEFLVKVARDQGARYIATGHTLDDQIETIWLRILRGTGVAGLRGIQLFRELQPQLTLVRPLLAIRRQQLLDYLQFHKIAYREDSSNRELRFTRNRVRHQLLPLVRDQFGNQIDGAVLSLAADAAEFHDLAAAAADQLRQTAVATQTSGGFELRMAALKTAQPLVVKVLLRQLWTEHQWPLRQMSREKWNLLQQMIASANDDTDQALFPGGIVVRCDSQQVSFQANGELDANR